MPTYSFKCDLCAESFDYSCCSSERPQTITCSKCQGTARYQFIPAALIITCPLSLQDQKDRAWIEYYNKRSSQQIRKWEADQQAYADAQSKAPERPSFEKCLDEARRELTHKGVNYQSPTI